MFSFADDEHKKYPVAHALIQKTSMFAVVLTLTPVYFTVPREGLSIKPFEKEEVQLQFKPKTFEGQDTKCILRVSRIRECIFKMSGKQEQFGETYESR